MNRLLMRVVGTPRMADMPPCLLTSVPYRGLRPQPNGGQARPLNAIQLLTPDS